MVSFLGMVAVFGLMAVGFPVFCVSSLLGICYAVRMVVILIFFPWMRYRNRQLHSEIADLTLRKRVIQMENGLDFWCMKIDAINITVCGLVSCVFVSLFWFIGHYRDCPAVYKGMDAWSDSGTVLKFFCTLVGLVYYFMWHELAVSKNDKIFEVHTEIVNLKHPAKK